MTKAESQSTEVAVRKPMDLLAFLATAKPLPEFIADNVNGVGWARALLKNETYVEPDPSYLETRFLMQTLNASTIEDLMTDDSLTKLQEWLPNAFGATTGVQELLNIYVAPSDMEDGAKTYVIFDCLGLSDGIQRTVSTGAKDVQAKFIKLFALGVWPITFEIKRTDRKGAGDQLLMKLYPVL